MEGEERLVADYLDRLKRELQVAPEEADDILREVRSHFEAASLEAGQRGRDAAVVLPQVLERFGPAAQIGQELRQVHGRATWREALLAAVPLLLFGWLAFALPGLDGSELWLAKPVLFALATAWAWRARWPLWWWAWLGWLPFALPGVPSNVLWSAFFYFVLMLLVIRRDWREATLTVYPLPTMWAFRYITLTSGEVVHVGWGRLALALLALGLTAIWAWLLIHMLRTPSRAGRVGRALFSQAIILVLHVATIVAARFWPTYPFPYAFTLPYFVFVTVPYSLFNGLPFLLFFLLASWPAMAAFIQARVRQRPPSHPATSN